MGSFDDIIIWGVCQEERLLDARNRLKCSCIYEDSFEIQYMDYEATLRKFA